MSNVTPRPKPGFAAQGPVRTTFRVLGVVITGTALVCLAIGGVDFFSSMNSWEGPTKFWMFLVGVPMLAVGGWCLQAGPRPRRCPAPSAGPAAPATTRTRASATRAAP